MTRAGEVWIVDLKRRVVEAYRRPGLEGFADRTTYRSGESVTLTLAPGIAIEVGQILG